MYNCVLLCGGKGNRLRALTDDRLPKSLVKVGGRELIRYTLDLLKPSFVDRLILAVDHHSDQISEFVMAADLPYPVSFSYQSHPGLLDAVRCAARVSSRDSILFLHTDEVRPGFQLEDALKFHKRLGSIATVIATNATNRDSDWVVEYDETAFQVSGFKIQPHEERRAVVLAGAFILNQAAMSYLDPLVSSEYLGIVQPLVDAGLLYVFISPTVAHFNVGTPSEFAEAEAFLRRNTPIDGQG